MENSDAMKRYPLHTTPYFRRSSTIFSPSVPSSHFNSPIRGSTPRITDNCRCPCTCANELSNLSSAGDPDPITRTSRKHWQDDDKENEAMLPSLPPQKKQRLYAERRSTNEKLQNLFQTIDDAGWSMSDFLYYTFRNKDSKGKAVNRDHSHASTVQKFLSGQTRYNPAHIIAFWFNHRDGRLEKQSDLMYLTTVPYTEIKPVRPCLTSFAVQIVERRLVQEAINAVKPSSGLHAVASRKSALKKAEWVDVGATTAPEVSGVLRTLQPLTWYYLTQIATRKPRVRGGIVQVRKRRPVEAVSTIMATFLEPSHAMSF